MYYVWNTDDPPHNGDYVVTYDYDYDGEICRDIFTAYYYNGKWFYKLPTGEVGDPIEDDIFDRVLAWTIINPYDENMTGDLDDYKW